MPSALPIVIQLSFLDSFCYTGLEYEDGWGGPLFSGNFYALTDVNIELFDEMGSWSSECLPCGLSFERDELLSNLSLSEIDDPELTLNLNTY